MKFIIPREQQYKTIIGKKYVSRYEPNFKIQIVGYAYNKSKNHSYFILKSLTLKSDADSRRIMSILSYLRYEIERFDSEIYFTYQLCPCDKFNNSFIKD